MFEQPVLLRGSWRNSGVAPDPPPSNAVPAEAAAACAHLASLIFPALRFRAHDDGFTLKTCTLSTIETSLSACQRFGLVEPGYLLRQETLVITRNSKFLLL